MGWHGTLTLRYLWRDAETLVRDRHDGPLRVLKSLHPEGRDVCHSVLVHPPGGMVGGDTLAIDLHLESGAHALVTTAGATRFYRSTGAPASQSLTVHAEATSRFEWLPLESIAFNGCIGENRARFSLDAGAEMIGWDVTALGLPASDQPFAAGRFTQQLELDGAWLERGTTRGDDARLLDSPLGWAGHRVLATAWFAAGSAIAEPRRETLLAAARSVIGGHALASSAGASAPHARAIVVRVLAPRVEPAMTLLVDLWRAWRPLAWNRAACLPRLWRT